MSARPTIVTIQEPPKRRAGSRAVFSTAALEVFLLLIVTGIVFILSRVVDYPTGNNSRTLFGIALALLPLGLFFFISWQVESNVVQPRRGLLTVLGLTMLAANGIGIPLVERVFAVDEWLSTTSGLQRIIGYMLTAGFTQEFIKLAVVRFSVWNEHLHTRRDGVAFSLVAGVGYATALSLNYVLANPLLPPEPAASALRVAGFALSQMAISTICGYALGDLKVGSPSVFWLPFSLAFAAFLQGLFVTLRAGIIVGTFGESSTGSQTISGLGVAIFLVITVFSIVRFMITNTESRERRSPEFHR